MTATRAALIEQDHARTHLAACLGKLETAVKDMTTQLHVDGTVDMRRFNNRVLAVEEAREILGAISQNVRNRMRVAG